MSPRQATARGARPQIETLPGMEPPGAPVPSDTARDLTDEQIEAVRRRAEPLLLSAAAGSGKTSVLVERFVRAVCEDGVAPGRILAITFTERAAGELRERVRTRLLELGERQAARDTEAAFVGTFHGFCASLLRAHPLAAGLDPDFAVLEEGTAGRLRERAFDTAVRKFLAEDRQEAADLLAAYGIDRVRTMLVQVYLELRSRGERLPRLPAPVSATGTPMVDVAMAAGIAPAIGSDDAEVEERDLEATGVCALLDELLDHFGRSYETRKQERAAVDFDDLELLAQLVLEERESLRLAWSERFELLMVDEFQDTNPRQLAILRALDRGNLFTVGDELQSIYGFRHADVSLFRERRAELEQRGGSLPLSQNFRSVPELLEVLNAIFASRFESFTSLRQGREVETEERGGQEPSVELLLSDSAGWEADEELAERISAGLPGSQLWRQAEARMLAGRVAELVASDRARPGEIAVLLRASGDLEVFERALQLRGLRTLAAVGAFWGHQQIGDLVAYLRVLANPLDEEALYGVLASPLAGCSRDCLALLARAARASGGGVWETAKAIAGIEQPAPEPRPGPELEPEAEPARGPEPARQPVDVPLATCDRAALAKAVKLIASERAGVARHTISALIERGIEATGYRAHVLSLDWGERRLANVHKLLRLAREFEAREGRDLRGFLEQVEYLRGSAAIEPDAPVEGAEPDAVRLMTVHAAKGLEFGVVCVADLGRLPNARTPDLLVEGPRMGVRLMRLDGERSVPALEYEELCTQRREREAQEEDRILYVAMTRARDLLLLSGSVDFGRWPRVGAGCSPLAWLGAAIDERLPGLLASGEPAPGEIALGPEGAGRVRLILNSAAAPALGGLGSHTPPREGGPSPAVPPSGESWPVAQPSSATRSTTHEPPQITALSYSSLTELERCGYRYYLERVLGLGEDRAAARALSRAEDGLEARARGTLVHRLMELMDFANPQAPSPAEVGERARELGLRVAESEREELTALIAASCTSELASRVAAGTSVRREHPFAFSLAPSEPLISGVIDLLAVEADGSILVLDYKSDRVGSGMDLEALVEREYGVQRLLYALAMLRDGAQSVEIVHWFLERGEWVTARFAAGERLVLEDRLARRVKRAQERGFAVSPRPHRGLCLTCPGRAGLCSWSESETLREHL
ncbi:MAG TPA: UvrD-helicase domain-containing protein [Solirubrobacteraceae bacterium]|nr:UvrD-helicase domain-containing protein [Solirubrobacteraceae bacterium]